MDQIGQLTISNRPATNYEKAKAYRQRKISLQSLLKDIFLMMIGISSAAFALKSFLLPSNFIDGGATGIALLLGEITDF